MDDLFLAFRAHSSRTVRLGRLVAFRRLRRLPVIVFVVLGRGLGEGRRKEGDGGEGKEGEKKKPDHNDCLAHCEGRKRVVSVCARVSVCACELLSE